MKKILFSLLILLMAVMSYAADDAKVDLQWNAPTERVLDMNCDNPGSPLTPEEISRLLYTVFYREKTATPGPWLTEETSILVHEITDLKWSTTYQFYVGAHWPGDAVFCPTNIVEKTTSNGPPPGACSGLVVN